MHEPGPKLDALIHGHAFGIASGESPPYSTDIAAAYTVLAAYDGYCGLIKYRMKRSAIGLPDEDRWEASFWMGVGVVSEISPDPCLAICRARLLARPVNPKPQT